MGDHFQVLRVSEGTCTVLRTYLPTIRYSVLYGTAYLPTRTVRYRQYNTLHRSYLIPIRYNIKYLSIFIAFLYGLVTPSPTYCVSGLQQALSEFLTSSYVRSTVHVPSDTLWTWKWSPTPDRYLFLRATEGPGSGPPPPECYPS